MQLMALGKNESGDLLFPAVAEDALVQALTAGLERNAAALKRMARDTERGLAFRGEVARRVQDAGDPREAGWAFAVSSANPRRNEIIEILKPLADLRGMENPAEPLVFDAASEDMWGEWLQDNYYARELEGRKVPQYVLFIGGPQDLPFRLQSLMDCVANVGRLDFDHLDDLDRYVRKIIRLEGAPGPVVERDVILFGTDGGAQDPTYFSREYMVKPLADYVERELKFRTSRLMGDDATKAKLTSKLRSMKPAVVYTASHGLGLTGQPLDRQKALNGAICCQSSGALTLADLFSADDVPTGEAFLEGAVFFQFACFGYGTPAQSDFSHWLTGMSEKCASEDFTAALPKRLLGLDRGPIAFVGHVDTAFLHGFTDPHEPHLLERWSNRMQPFVHAVETLLAVQPSGLAMIGMNRKYSIANALLTTVYDRQRRGTLAWTPESSRRFVDNWIARSDAQNYLVFGDPAARLRIPDA
jgi:hypothetical protein